MIAWNDHTLYLRAPRITGLMTPAIKSYLIKPSAPSYCLKVGATTFPKLYGMSPSLFSDGFYHLVSVIP